MKRILIIITIIPFITFAQSKNITATKPPLIESITSDTLNGIFYQVVFSYDERNRVTGITHKRYRIIKDSAKKNKLVDAITESQTFEYQGSAEQPYVRVANAYNNRENNDKWVLWRILKTYFLYKNGQRIGDSSLFQHNGYFRKDDYTWDNNIKTDGRVSKLQQTKRRIYQKDTITNSGYLDSKIRKITINPFNNISNDLEKIHTSDRGFVKIVENIIDFKAYDSMVNPLKQLNIANALCNEKISFELSNENESFDDVDVIFNVDWYFLNQNNVLKYIKPYGSYLDTTLKYKDVYSLKYRYNQYKQPVYVNIQFEYLRRNREATEELYILLKKFEKNFTFRYKK